MLISGADPGFQVGGGGGADLFFWGVFRVKNHDFTPKNNILSNFMGGGGDLDPSLGHQFRNLLTLIVENWSKFWY